MSRFVEGFTYQGRKEGSTILMRLLALKFGPPGDLIRVRVQQADLKVWESGLTRLLKTLKRMAAKPLK